MKEITNLMIREYKLKNIDFMGYRFSRNEASFHHLLIPRRMGGKEEIGNGAILNRRSSHPYIHIIEGRDYDMYREITEEMLKENMLGRLDVSCLRRIDDILSCFEREHSSDRTAKGRCLIREEYIRGRKHFTKE